MKKLFLKFTLFFLLIVGITGCEVIPFVGPIVTGVIMWHKGEANKYYYEETSTLYRSVKIALKELGHPINKDEIKRNGIHYIFAGDNDKFKIIIRKVNPNISEVRLRINFIGNKPYAELIYKHIDKYLNVIDFDGQGHRS